jgi:hypothetical protein
MAETLSVHQDWLPYVARAPWSIEKSLLTLTVGARQRLPLLFLQHTGKDELFPANSVLRQPSFLLRNSKNSPHSGYTFALTSIRAVRAREPTRENSLRT